MHLLAVPAPFRAPRKGPRGLVKVKQSRRNQSLVNDRPIQYRCRARLRPPVTGRGSVAAAQGPATWAHPPGNDEECVLSQYRDCVGPEVGFLALAQGSYHFTWTKFRQSDTNALDARSCLLPHPFLAPAPPRPLTHTLLLKSCEETDCVRKSPHSVTNICSRRH